MLQKEIYERIIEMIGKGEPAALISVVETKGSAPGREGFKMVVDRQGGTLGTVGGGLIEAEAIKDALSAIEEGRSRMKNYRLDQETAGSLGMLCGGEVSLFIDVVVPPPSLVIVGAGHIAQPLAAMAKIVGFTVTVVDDRDDFCSRERFPGADELLVGEMEKVLEELEVHGGSYIVIVTRGHAFDQLALEKMLPREVPYLGMIGSRKKVQKIFQNVTQKGFSEEKLQRVKAPIGLDIGALTAEEIAVSILAQIISVKNKC